MKYYKVLFIYICIVFGLLQLYDSLTVTQILIHYPYFDLKYFIFLFIQFFWVTLLFQYVYQYISLYTLICIRLTKKDFIRIWITKFVQFSVLLLPAYCNIFILFFTNTSFSIILKPVHRKSKPCFYYTFSKNLGL